MEEGKGNKESSLCEEDVTRIRMSAMCPFTHMIEGDYLFTSKVGLTSDMKRALELLLKGIGDCIFPTDGAEMTNDEWEAYQTILFGNNGLMKLYEQDKRVVLNDALWQARSIPREEEMAEDDVILDIVVILDNKLTYNLG